MNIQLHNTFGIPFEVLEPETTALASKFVLVSEVTSPCAVDRELLAERFVAALGTYSPTWAHAPFATTASGMSFSMKLSTDEHARAASWLAENHPDNLTEAARVTLSHELTGHFVRGLSSLSPQDADVALKAIISLA